VFDPETLIRSFGYIGLFVIIFLETGLLVGFFLPGDTLLISAGVAAAGGLISLPGAMIACALGSVCGDQLGYYIGYKLGPRVFTRAESRLFDPKNVDRAREFFKRFGPFAIVIARFVPVVRAFVPTMAGVSRFPYLTFLGFSALGAILWGTSVTAIGYFLVSLVPGLKRYIEVIIILGVLAGLLPSLWHIFGPKRSVQK
jgi:membrane-associated protein